ncbi:MAG: flagellar biosynthetic protein FliR [Deltaproteobacteria bacterium]|nr:flagellar biosynthetic protein FliR [Deltaproteobacteria bacterium]
MNNLGDLTHYFSNFLILFIRLGVILSFLPFLSGKQVPRQFKAGLIITLAYVLAPVITMEIKTSDLPTIIVQELLLGLTIGFAVRLIFWGVELAGTLISDAMGISMATMFNPEIGQSTEISTLLGLIAMLLFLTLDLHHDLLYMIVKSYEIIPVTKIQVDTLWVNGISLSGQIFVMGLKIAAPVLVGMIIVNILMGFIYKAAPQINIFFVSMPVHLFVGLLILLFSTPLLIHFLEVRFSGLNEEINRIIIMAKG